MQNLLIVGFGDVARRTLPLLKNWRVFALVRNPEAAAACRKLGVIPRYGDLDDLPSLTCLAGLADAVLYTAPPPAHGLSDPRPHKLLAALAKRQSLPQRWVYISTTGVYGDAGGAWIGETTPCRPGSARGERRLAAEGSMRTAAQRHGFSLTILRAPGIYAAERLPLERLATDTPMIEAGDDSVTNHIHADDLAALCAAALTQRRHGIRIYNACDNEPLPMGDWFDLLADTFALPRLPRLPRAEVQARVSPALWSYLSESRRISNARLKREFKFRLAYPTVRHALANPQRG